MRFFTLLLATLLAGAACLAGWLLWVVPPATRLFWLLPVVMLICAVLIAWRKQGGAAVLPVVLLGGGLAWAAAVLVWPDQGPGQASPASGRNAAEPEHQVEISLQVPQSYRLGPLTETRRLSAVRGLSAGVFAAGLGPARFMAVHADGTLLVSVPKEGKVLALPDANGDGVADRIVTFAAGLDRPHGLAIREQEVIVAENSRLTSLLDRDGDLQADEQRVLSEDLPSGGGHWTRTIVIGPQGDLLVSAGSSCNVCEEEDPRRAAVMRFDPGGGEGEIFAQGLRNSVGLAIHPETGELWGSDNGRDMLGDNLPPDEINRIVAGGDYGWPYCYGDRIADPEFNRPERCTETRIPAVNLQAHSAPLGIAFGAGLDFPERFREMLFVAYHGSWNRRIPTGYKLVGMPFAGGRPTGEVIDIVTGWLVGRNAWGRPVDPLVGADGALYLSDDRAGAVYRLTWQGEETTSGAEQ